MDKIKYMKFKKKKEMHIFRPNAHNPDKIISIMKPILIEAKLCSVCFLCVVPEPVIFFFIIIFILPSLPRPLPHKSHCLQGVSLAAANFSRTDAKNAANRSQAALLLFLGHPVFCSHGRFVEDIFKPPPGFFSFLRSLL